MGPPLKRQRTNHNTSTLALVPIADNIVKDIIGVVVLDEIDPADIVRDFIDKLLSTTQYDLGCLEHECHHCRALH